MDATDNRLYLWIFLSVFTMVMLQLETRPLGQMIILLLATSVAAPELARGLYYGLVPKNKAIKDSATRVVLEARNLSDDASLIYLRDASVRKTLLEFDEVDRKFARIVNVCVGVALLYILLLLVVKQRRGSPREQAGGQPDSEDPAIAAALLDYGDREPEEKPAIAAAFLDYGIKEPAEKPAIAAAFLDYGIEDPTEKPVIAAVFLDYGMKDPTEKPKIVAAFLDYGTQIPYEKVSLEIAPTPYIAPRLVDLSEDGIDGASEGSQRIPTDMTTRQNKDLLNKKTRGLNLVSALRPKYLEFRLIVLVILLAFVAFLPVFFDFDPDAKKKSEEEFAERDRDVDLNYIADIERRLQMVEKGPEVLLKPGLYLAGLLIVRFS